MQKEIRKNIITQLQAHYQSAALLQRIKTHLNQKGIANIFIDHFAVIDLPSPHSGIPTLCKIFKALGFTVRGNDYLPDKQNDFCWLAEEGCENELAQNVLPQVVVADFRMEALPFEVKKIIEKYTRYIHEAPVKNILHCLKSMEKEAALQSHPFYALIHTYFAGREWPLPHTKEFYTVKEFNELLAWVLIFGRQPNHFTLSVHLMGAFADLPDFHEFLINDVKLTLSTEGGLIKGGQTAGIAQSATVALSQTIILPDGDITLPGGFVEFVWRYPKPELGERPPILWNDYFTGFIAKQANHVIESLYENEDSLKSHP